MGLRSHHPVWGATERGYGPTVREVVPGFLVVCGVVAAPVLLCGWLYARFRLAGLLPALAVVGAIAVPLVRWGRAASRRHGGIWSEDELLALQDDQLYAAVRTVLRRDGWRIRNVPCDDRPRLAGRHPRTRIRIDVAFRLPGEGAADLDAPVPDDPPGGAVRLLVSRGEFSPGDQRRAHRHDGTHLIGRHRLTAWASGLPLEELIGLGPQLDGELRSGEKGQVGQPEPDEEDDDASTSEP